MHVLLVLLLAAPDQPEPGPIPIRSIDVEELVIPRVPGNADVALQEFLTAHRAHKQGKLDQALKAYLRFLGMSGHRELPARYLATVKARLDTMQERVTARYEKAAKLYAKDRAKGLAEFRLISARYPLLPEGVAALKFWHTDGLQEAIRTAREAKDKKAAAVELAKAIKRFTAGIYRYEAKSLLVDLGGPDLFEPGERIGDDDDE